MYSRVVQTLSFLLILILASRTQAVENGTAQPGPRQTSPTTARGTQRTASKATPHPNFLIILADDMGYSDAGCYGGEIATPNLDRLARNGLRFSQFYTTSRCWPSRAALLTGYYAHAVRRDTLPGIRSGAQGIRPAWARLLPERLRPLGYHTYHSGKWHIDGMPLQSGFEHSYSLNDHDRAFNPREHTLDDRSLPPVSSTSGYYSTTFIASHAIQCLQQHASAHPGEPFFQFIAFTAPHFPLQAPASDISRYRDHYQTGWDQLRLERWTRQHSLGIEGNSLSSIERNLGPPYSFPEAIKHLGPAEIDRPLPWIELTPDQKHLQATKMAIHAAMIDRMDQEIGRVIAQLESMNALENTLILFLSDNGASAEIMVRGDGHDPGKEPGSPGTFLSLGPGGSSLANTPFRRHKTWVHEGGIASPLIVHWPRGLTARGKWRATPAHLVDIAPTLLHAAGESLASDPGAGDDPPVKGCSQKGDARWRGHHFTFEPRRCTRCT